MPNSSAMPQRESVDLAVVHLTFEGIQTHGGGVATVTRGHLRALPAVREALAAEQVALTPYFAEIAYRKDHPRRDLAFERRALRIVGDMGGAVQYLVNDTQGLVPNAVWGEGDLGSLENWKIASASGAAAALNWARRHAETVIYCHDVVFALAAIYATLQATAFASHATALYVVHSTALTHELPLPNPERLMAESGAIHWSKVMSTCKLGYISEFIAEHLRRDYGAQSDGLVPAGNGINPRDDYFRERDLESIAAKLRVYGIPLDKPLVCSWGRPVPYKRYDVALEAAALTRGRVHPVIVLSEEYPKLRELARSLGVNASLVATFDPELVASLLQWERTVAALSLAHNEPFGLTPVEARMLSRRRGPLMVVSDTGGLAEQVQNGVDGFTTKQDDPNDVARAIDTILALTPERRDAIRRAGVETVLRSYTWSTQMLKTLGAIYPRWAQRFERAHDKLAQEDLRSLGLQARSA